MGRDGNRNVKARRITRQKNPKEDLKHQQLAASARRKTQECLQLHVNVSRHLTTVSKITDGYKDRNLAHTLAARK